MVFFSFCFTQLLSKNMAGGLNKTSYVLFFIKRLMKNDLSVASPLHLSLLGQAETEAFLEATAFLGGWPEQHVCADRYPTVLVDCNPILSLQAKQGSHGFITIEPWPAGVTKN